MNGLDHFYDRAKDFGIRWYPKSIPVTSMGLGTIEVHPIDLLGAYGAIADGGKLVQRTTILKVTTADGTVIWPDAATKPKVTKVMSAQAAYIITDILKGNTEAKTNPFWAEWAVTDNGKRRPAAYKTGTTSNNVDVHAYGFLAPPKDPKAPALAVGVWMGNSNNEANRDTLSLGSSAPLWSRILSEVSKGTPIADFRPPKGLVVANVDAISGQKPGPFTTKTVKEYFLPGTEPTQRDDLRRTVDIDAASGLRWQDGCVGPRRTVGALDFREVEAAWPAWQRAVNRWTARASRGAGVGGGLKGTRTQYLYGSGFYPFGRTWGGIFAPSALCPLAPPPSAPVCDNLFGLFCPSLPPGTEPSGPPNPNPTKAPKP